MKYNPEIHHRRSIRLKGYDYSQPGAYFITICVQNRGCILGEVAGDNVVLSQAGWHIQNVWNELNVRYPCVDLGAFCVMPNHVHGIIIITAEGSRVPITEIVGVFKSLSARRINQDAKTAGNPFWQRNYYEHIIRNPTEFERIEAYIRQNPAKWQEDALYPSHR